MSNVNGLFLGSCRRTRLEVGLGSWNEEMNFVSCNYELRYTV